MFGGGINVGDATWTLRADDKELLNDVRESGKKVEAESNKFMKHSRAIGVGMTVAGAAITGTMAAAINSYAKAGDEVGKMAVRTGISTQALSELRHAANLSGTSLSGFEKSIRRMQRAITEAGEGKAEYTESLEALGLQYEDLAGKKPEDQFMVIAEALGEVEDDTTKASLAQEIFGRSGTALLPMLKGGAEGLAQMRAEARELGITFDAESSKAAEDFNDNMERLWKSFEGVGNQLAGALIPIINEWLPVVTEAIKSVMEWMRENKELTAAITIVTTAIGALLITAGPILVLLPSLTSGFTILTGALGGTATALGAVTAAAAPFVAGAGIVVLAFDAIHKAVWLGNDILLEYHKTKVADAEWDVKNAELKKRLAAEEVETMEELVQKRVENRLEKLRAADATEIAEAKRRGQTVAEYEQELVNHINRIRERRGLDTIESEQRISEAVVEVKEQANEEEIVINEQNTENQAKWQLEREEHLLKLVTKTKTKLKEVIKEYRTFYQAVKESTGMIIEALGSFDLNYEKALEKLHETTTDWVTKIKWELGSIVDAIHAAERQMTSSTINGGMAAAAAGGGGGSSVSNNVQVDMGGVSVGSQGQADSLSTGLANEIGRRLAARGVR
jgi:hypothetical protein